MNRAEKAVEYKHSGANCAQAVLLALADEFELDDETLGKLGSGFGVGMGTLDATCGALCAAQMVLGLKNYKGYPILRDAKEITEIFKTRVGALRCGDIKGVETGDILCPCDDCIRHAVDILEEMGIV